MAAHTFLLRFNRPLLDNNQEMLLGIDFGGMAKLGAGLFLPRHRQQAFGMNFPGENQLVDCVVGRLRVGPHTRGTSLGRVARDQKMLKGHLPRVMYHQVYSYPERSHTRGTSLGATQPARALLLERLR